MYNFLRFILALAGILTTSSVSAGSLQVSPIRITLSAQMPIAALTVHNKSAEPRVIQLEGMSWVQAEGEDNYMPTREMLATPPIFSIAAGGTQIIRVGLRRQPDSRRELAYRLFLQEVPGETAKEGEVKMVLRLGIPVFVLPDGGVPKPLLDWRIVEIPQKGLRVEAINRGDAHVQISSFSLTGANGEPILPEHHEMKYLLPEQRRHWLISSSRTFSAGAKVKIMARTDSGDFHAEVALEQ